MPWCGPTPVSLHTLVSMVAGAGMHDTLRIDPWAFPACFLDKTTQQKGAQSIVVLKHHGPSEGLGRRPKSRCNNVLFGGVGSFSSGSACVNGCRTLPFARISWNGAWRPGGFTDSIP